MLTKSQRLNSCQITSSCQFQIHRKSLTYSTRVLDDYCASFLRAIRARSLAQLPYLQPLDDALFSHAVTVRHVKRSHMTEFIGQVPAH